MQHCSSDVKLEIGTDVTYTPDT